MVVGRQRFNRGRKGSVFGFLHLAARSANQKLAAGFMLRVAAGHERIKRLDPVHNQLQRGEQIIALEIKSSVR